MAERPVVPEKPGNSGGGKGPQVRTGEGKCEGLREWLGLEPRFEFGSAGTTACESEGERPWDRAEAGDCGRWRRGEDRLAAGIGSGRGEEGEVPLSRCGRREVVAPFPPMTNRPVCERHGPTGEPVAGKPHGGFGERGEETWPWWRMRHRHDGESRRQQRLPPTYRRRASPRLYITEAIVGWFNSISVVFLSI